MKPPPDKLADRMKAFTQRKEEEKPPQPSPARQTSSFKQRLEQMEQSETAKRLPATIGASNTDRLPSPAITSKPPETTSSKSKFAKRPA
jgi:hypothetical protein